MVRHAPLPKTKGLGFLTAEIKTGNLYRVLHNLRLLPTRSKGQITIQWSIIFQSEFSEKNIRFKIEMRELRDLRDQPESVGPADLRA